jgi:hypothetical protein
MKNKLTSGSARLEQKPAASVMGRKRRRTLDEDYGKHVNIYPDGSKMGDKVEYAVVKEEHTNKKRILTQNTMFSEEQSAIIEPIQSEKKSRHKIVVITNSLNTIMATENRTRTKNLKTQTIRKIF